MDGRNIRVLTAVVHLEGECILSKIVHSWRVTQIRCAPTQCSMLRLRQDDITNARTVHIVASECYLDVHVFLGADSFLMRNRPIIHADYVYYPFDRRCRDKAIARRKADHS